MNEALPRDRALPMPASAQEKQPGGGRCRRPCSGWYRSAVCCGLADGAADPQPTGPAAAGSGQDPGGRPAAAAISGPSDAATGRTETKQKTIGPAVPDG